MREEIETVRLFLREMDRNDFDALYKVLTDTETMRHYPYAFDEARVSGWIERNKNRYRENGFGLWAVCLKETGEMIRDCGLTLQTINGNVLPEIGYHIRRDCQRRGYAKEAWLNELTVNMINWAENKLGSAEYAGWCLSFIEDALEKSNGIEVFGGDSAKESCELYKNALRGGMPERGAFVFYNCLCPGENGPVNWGHCGISLGDSRVIHAWDMVRIDDYLAIEKLTALTGDHPEYLGWVPLERVLNQKPYQGRIRG